MAYVMTQKQQCILMPHTLISLPSTTSLKVTGAAVWLLHAQFRNVRSQMTLTSFSQNDTWLAANI